MTIDQLHAESVEVLKMLISIPSLSRDEKAAADRWKRFWSKWAIHPNGEKTIAGWWHRDIRLVDQPFF